MTPASVYTNVGPAAMAISHVHYTLTTRFGPFICHNGKVKKSFLPSTMKFIFQGVISCPKKKKRWIHAHHYFSSIVHNSHHTRSTSTCELIQLPPHPPAPVPKNPHKSPILTLHCRANASMWLRNMLLLLERLTPMLECYCTVIHWSFAANRCLLLYLPSRKRIPGYFLRAEARAMGPV